MLQRACFLLFAFALTAAAQAPKPHLSLSPWALRRIIQAGEIPIVKVGEGAPWLLDVRDLDSWVDHHKHTVD